MQIRFRDLEIFLTLDGKNLDPGCENFVPSGVRYQEFTILSML